MEQEVKVRVKHMFISSPPYMHHLTQQVQMTPREFLTLRSDLLDTNWKTLTALRVGCCYRQENCAVHISTSLGDNTLLQ